MCAFVLFVVTIVKVVNVVVIVVMVFDEGFSVVAVGVVAVNSCVFLVVVLVIADGFARCGCGIFIMCECRGGTGYIKQLSQLVGQFIQG